MNHLQLQTSQSFPEEQSDVSLRDIMSMLRRRRKLILGIWLPSLLLIVAVCWFMPWKWASEAQLVLVTRLPSAPQAGEDYAPPSSDTIDTEMAMIQSDGMISRAMDWLNAHPDQLALIMKKEKHFDFDSFDKSVTVDNPKNTNAMNVLVKGRTPLVAQIKATAITEAFIDWKNELARHDVIVAIQNLEHRLPVVRANLMAAEGKLAEFQHRYKIIDSANQDKALLDRLAQTAASMDSTKQELQSYQAQYDALGSRLKETNKALVTGGGVRDDALVQSLQSQLTLALQQYNADQQIYTSKYPGVLSQDEAKVKDLRARLADAIRGSADNTRPSLQSQGTLLDNYNAARVTVALTRAKLDAATSEYGSLKTQLSQLPSVDMQYVQLLRDRDVLTNLYTSLLTAVNAARVDRDRISSDVQISQAPMLPDWKDVASPSIKMVALLAILLPLVLAGIVVLIAEQSRPNLYDLDRIRYVLPGPVVGTLPYLAPKQLDATTNGNLVPIVQEMYSLAYANLALAMRDPLNGDIKHPVIVVTSSLPGEGKSITAAQLSRAIALTGKTVILVDADMRKPSQTAVKGPAKRRRGNDAQIHFANPLAIGLADVLEGAATVKEAVVTTDVPNLSLLAAGTATRNPIELVSRSHLQEALSSLRGMADVIVVDTPACSVVADALFIAPHADCILHVIGTGQVNQSTIRDTTAALDAAAPDRTLFLVNYAPKEDIQGYGYYQTALNGRVKKLTTGGNVATINKN